MSASTALAEVLTAESLTTILGRTVERVDIVHEARHYSSVARAVAHCADGGPPRCLFAKTAPRASEVAFHTDIQHRLDAPAVTCVYAAMHDGEGILVFEDISPTHREPKRRLETKTYEAIVDVLAAYHARGFDNATAAERENRGFEFVITQARRALPAFFDAAGVTAHERTVIETALARWPAVHRARIEDGRHLTVLHGDIHPGNVMLPIEGGGNASIVFVDWSDWRVEPGPVDLSFLLLTMRPDQRRDAERDLVTRWHAALGPTAYRAEDAWNDYRVATAGSLLHALHWWVGGSPEWIWHAGLRARLTAVADLDALDAL